MRLLHRTTPDDFKIINVNGRTVTDQEGISIEIVDFYKNLYENFDRIESTDDLEFFNKLESVSGEEEANIIKPLTLEELRSTLHSCVDSAPGPDGIPYSVIALLWPTFGPLLLEAWLHSLVIGKLTPSHKLSYLKLIPKVGKDLTLLTNWRPITLSNCDHKLITKTYATRMSSNVARQISGCQTAYLRNRLINDNIRAIDGTINLTNLEQRAKGLLVALDAKKAFDSVDHKYIEKCLSAFGCGGFIPIFRTLYSDLETNIIINGVITKGFAIRRGVKQGDALSCIIFIMCMEPLLRNIEANPGIEAIFSSMLNKPLPKVYAYADDVNATIKDTISGLECLFNEYERLTKMSGLELNADKTELMLLGSNPVEKSYNVSYLNQNYNVTSKEKVKIIGILFQRDRQQMKTENVDLAISKIDKHFKNWSRRNLSTLGKILIVKCFGISQFIYLLQSLCIEKVHYKKLNAILYKFIWNRHYLAAKAPERIKREIVNTPIRMGGLGMLDIVALDEGLKLKALGRLVGTNHPYLRLIKEKLNLRQFFNPTVELKIDEVSAMGAKLLTYDRDRLWENRGLDSHRDLLSAIADTDLKILLNERGKASIPFYVLWARGVRKVKDLTVRDLVGLSRYIDKKQYKKLELAISTRSGRIPASPFFLESYFLKNRNKPLQAATSKEIRIARCTKEPILELKLGAIHTESETRSWGLKVTKLTNMRHKNLLLRIAHGEIYTKEKLHRFGMIDSPQCPRCEEIETLRHKFIECPYVERIWTLIRNLTSRLTIGDLDLETPEKFLIGSYLISNCTTLTLNAEVAQRILVLRDDLDYVTHPKIFVKQAVLFLIKREKGGKVKADLSSILPRIST